MTAFIAGMALLAAAPPGNVCEKDVAFIGFSEDETLAAWRIEARCKESRGRFVDRYSIVRVVETLGNEEVGSYRLADIRRSNGKGAWIDARVEEMAERNPEWGEAGPRSEWLDLKKEARFSFQVLGEDEAFVAVSPDSDVSLASRYVDRQIMVTTKRGRSLGFTVSFVGSARVQLGHFRQDGEPGHAVTANLQILRSRTAKHLAALTRFEVKGEGSLRTASYGRIVGMRQAEVAASSQLPVYQVNPAAYYPDPSLQLAERLSGGANLNLGILAPPFRW